MEWRGRRQHLIQQGANREPHRFRRRKAGIWHDAEPFLYNPQHALGLGRAQGIRRDGSAQQVESSLEVWFP